MKQIVPNLWELEVSDVVHCYAWEWADGVTLIDTSLPGDGEKILAALQQHDIPPHRVQRILITHMDMDHVGGLPAIRAATGAPVVCHAVEKEFMEHPRRRQPAFVYLRPLFWAATLLIPRFRQPPVTPDELVVDGQMLPEGFTVVHTPGHTPGHISLLHRERRFLIAGDALNNRGGVLRTPPPIFTPDLHNAQRSIWKLAKKYGSDFDAIVFGHGEPLLQNGGKRIQGFASKIFATDV